MTSDFLKKMALSLGRRGHVCAMISQVRSVIKASQYAPSDPNETITVASGGNAALHYADWILEFKNKNSKKQTLYSDAAKTKKVGHNCQIQFKKSPNEKTMDLVAYPVKHGRTGGNSIWVEKEILEVLRQYNFITGTSWLSFSPEVFSQLKEAKVKDVPEKLQGENNMLDFLESRPEIVTFYYNYFKDAYIK